MIKVLYFASLREALGTGGEQFDLPEGVKTVGQLRAWLRERGGVWAEALAEDRAVRMAVDQLMSAPDAPVGPNAEVAFFPPVTGG